MNLTERLAELQELLIGLGVAVAVLVVIAWLMGIAGSAERRGDGEPRASTAQAALQQTHMTRRHGQQTAQTRPRRRSPPCTSPPGAGKPMERVAQVEAVAGRGLAGDRYLLETGHWSGTDDCQVTLIVQEDLDEIERQSGVAIQNGEHRRNIVVRNLPPGGL